MIEVIIVIMSMIFGQVWIIMIQPDYLFDFMGKYIDMIKIRKLRHLVLCSTCISGQLCLLSYPIAMIVSHGTYNVIIHVCMIAITIWITATVNKINNE